ncbi:hypothetical protein E2C01_053625 [Portunus trituberculatus]|uniref:Uncharacterized protein n=1 Tax=Portunus trituberculatus TaxID=210409 RepID=A0A5B7GHN2_PORTR|nr:hypothetical protein [Portunus trituberculatus]
MLYIPQNEVCCKVCAVIIISRKRNGRQHIKANHSTQDFPLPKNPRIILDWAEETLRNQPAVKPLHSITTHNTSPPHPSTSKRKKKKILTHIHASTYTDAPNFLRQDFSQSLNYGYHISQPLPQEKAFLGGSGRACREGESWGRVGQGRREDEEMEGAGRQVGDPIGFGKVFHK